MMKLLSDLRATVPHFGLLVGVPLAVVLAQLVFLRLALRKRRACLALEDQAAAGDFAAVLASPSPRAWTDLVCALAVLLIPATAVLCVATARAGFFAALRATDPQEKVAGIAHNLGGMLNVVPWSINVFVLAAVLAIVSLSLSVTSRQRMGRIKAAAAAGTASDPAVLAACRGAGGDNVAVIPAAFFTLGIFPVLAGAWVFCLGLIRDLAMVADVPGEERGVRLSEALERGQALFAQRAALALPGTLVAAALALALLWRWRRRHATPAKESVSWGGAVGFSVACLGAALLCWGIATPYRRENRMPWPPAQLSGDVLQVHDPQSPVLEGGDPVASAPVLWVAEGAVSLDGRAVDAEELQDQLRTAARVHRMLHPGGVFRGQLAVLGSAQVDTRTLATYLKAARAARYLELTFVFTRRESQVRPLLGRLSRVYATGAQATVQREPEDGEEAEAPAGQVLRLDAFRTYGDFARRVVELRKAGSEVSLAL